MSTLKVRAYATFEKGGPKKEHQFELGPLPDDWVDVRVTHSGRSYIASSSSFF